MKSEFLTLECNDDVLLFDNNASTVKNLIALLEINFQEKLFIINNDKNQKIANILQFISVTAPGSSGSLANFRFKDINWTSDKEGVNCKLLRVGASAWQPGKLRINASIKFFIQLSRPG